MLLKPIIELPELFQVVVSLIIRSRHLELPKLPRVSREIFGDKIYKKYILLVDWLTHVLQGESIFFHGLYKLTKIFSGFIGKLFLCRYGLYMGAQDHAVVSVAVSQHLQGDRVISVSDCYRCQKLCCIAFQRCFEILEHLFVLHGAVVVNCSSEQVEE